jgi:hypothetical protein
VGNTSGKSSVLKFFLNAVFILSVEHIYLKSFTCSKLLLYILFIALSLIPVTEHATYMITCLMRSLPDVCGFHDPSVFAERCNTFYMQRKLTSSKQCLGF